MNLKGLSKEVVDELAKLGGMVIEDMDLDVVEAHFLRHSYMRVLANWLRIAEQDRKIRFDDVNRFNADVHALFHREKIMHIVDWIRADIRAGAPWTTNLDEELRPRKLLKCSTVDDLMREADKAMGRRSAQMAKALGPADEERVADLGDGYTLVRLLSPAALDLEAVRMRHCIGDGAYDRKLATGWGQYLSVRDRKGRPVATVELENEPDAKHYLRQIAGRGNSRPDRGPMDALRDYARQHGWRKADWFWPVVRTPAGIEYDIDAIPEGVTIESLEITDVDLEIYPVLILPADLTVTGNTRLGREVRLPENLTVLGMLEFSVGVSHPPITLPESLDAREIRVGSLDDVARPVPTHLRHRIKCRVPKLTGHSFVDAQWDDEEQSLNDQSFRPM